MKISDIQDQFSEHVIANYNRTPVCFVRGEGSRLWDTEGREYLDLFPGWGVAGLGHCHPKVAEAICKQSKKLIHVANNFYNEEQGAFAEIISTHADNRKVYFCNSGAEANEAAIKLARLARQPRYKIVTMMESFHGRTFGAISATGQPEYQAGFSPIVPGFSYARMNDLASVAENIDQDTCAIMLEPVQGESGVIPATPEFLQGLRKLADEKNLLLIFDEVQTAPCRLGKWFGYQYYGVQPDIITTAKAIAGGMPMAAMLAKPEVAAALKPGTHASTFGGHSIGCAAGIAGWKAMEEEKVMDNVNTLGPWLDERLGAIVKPVMGVKAVRRAGFMIGIVLEFPGADLVADCRNHGLLINCTHGTVLRMLPALNISKEDLEKGVTILEECLDRAVRRTGSVRLTPVRD
ncbi:MAG: aspartate aminotransferase family protein [Planctomycetaceae bacterium]|nr:aspartate aminotransferase family protein [Planctomycetaceae bacterium]